jgi:hypothetical protein
MELHEIHHERYLWAYDIHSLRFEQREEKKVKQKRMKLNTMNLMNILTVKMRVWWQWYYEAIVHV